MSGSEHEKAFEDFLARRSGIAGRPDELESLEPPAELDRIVLANAREAIRTASAPRHYRPARWALPVSLAATVVLSFAVLLHLGLLPRPGKDAATELETHFHADDPDQDKAVADAQFEAAVPASPPVLLDMPSPAPAAKSAPQREPTSPARRAPVAEADQSRGAAANAREEVSVAGSRASAAQDMAAPASAASEEPAQWLRRIADLRAAGKAAEAEREWRSFRKAWPDYPVSEAPP